MTGNEMTPAERRGFEESAAEAEIVARDVTRIASNLAYEDLRHDMVTEAVSKAFYRAKALHRTEGANLVIAVMTIQNLGLTIEVLSDELAAARERGSMIFDPTLLKRAMDGAPGVLDEIVTYANGDQKKVAQLTTDDVNLMSAWLKAEAAREEFEALEYARVLRGQVEAEPS